MSKYAGFLSWLISMGPKVPRILALIEELIALLVPPKAEDAGTLQFVSVTPDEEDLEAQVFALTAAQDSQALALADGSRLRSLFKFLNDSGLLSILIGLATRGL